MNVYKWLPVGLLVLLSWSGPAAAQDKPFVWKEGKIEIHFPEAPEKNKFSLELPLEDGKINYVVSFQVVPQLLKVPASAHPAIFKSYRDGLIKQFKGKILSEKAVKPSGYPGREFTAEAGKIGVYRTQLILVRDRLYRLVVSGPKEVAASKEAERFFHSFKVIK